jgi:hypothetical protein
LDDAEDFGEGEGEILGGEIGIMGPAVRGAGGETVFGVGVAGEGAGVEELDQTQKVVQVKLVVLIKVGGMGRELTLVEPDAVGLVVGIGDEGIRIAIAVEITKGSVRTKSTTKSLTTIFKVPSNTVLPTALIEPDTVSGVSGRGVASGFPGCCAGGRGWSRGGM